jgi:hypothetical protein
VRTTLLAITLAATAAIAIPVIAQPADDPDAQYAQAGPMGRHGGAGDGGGEAGRHGWPMMHGMMHHMMMHRDPQERCTERLAWRAAMRAYAEAKLNLTADGAVGQGANRRSRGRRNVSCAGERAPGDIARPNGPYQQFL